MKLRFFEAGLTPPEPTPMPDFVPLQPPPDGLGALVIFNHLGGTLTVNIDNVLYTLSPKERLQVNTTPGQTTYSASYGPLGLNGGVWVTEGKYTGLSFAFRQPWPSGDQYRKSVPRFDNRLQLWDIAEKQLWDITVFDLVEDEPTVEDTIILSQQ